MQIIIFQLCHWMLFMIWKALFSFAFHSRFKKRVALSQPKQKMSEAKTKRRGRTVRRSFHSLDTMKNTDVILINIRKCLQFHVYNSIKYGIAQCYRCKTMKKKDQLEFGYQKIKRSGLSEVGLVTLSHCWILPGLIHTVFLARSLPFT